MDVFDAFHNATITVERSEGERTAKGYEETGTKTVLQCRGDYQDGGKSLERLQQLVEEADGLFFAENSVTDVEPGDSVTIDLDDDRTLTGTVEQARSFDDSLVISL